MIEKTSTNFTGYRLNKKQIVKYTAGGAIGASVGVGVAFIPRTYYPKYIKKSAHKLVLVKYFENPYKYGLWGAFIGILTVGLYNLIKNKKSNQ